MVQETSKEAFKEIELDLNRRQAQVLLVFKLNPNTDFTNSELEKLIHIPINQITPRTNELVSKGKLRAVTKRPCQVTGRTCIAWGLNKNQMELF